jgi:uncharacterized protein (DUF1778 family)
LKSPRIKHKAVTKTVAEQAAERATDAVQAQETAKSKQEKLIALVRKLNEGREPNDGLTSDHSWLYDENGLPH